MEDRIDPEEEQKLVAFIRGEYLKGTDLPTIRRKLIQAGWGEPTVVRLMEFAASRPDSSHDRAKVMNIEPVLVLEPDGNLKLKRDFVPAEVRKNREETKELPALKVFTNFDEEMILERRIQAVRMTGWAALVGLSLFHLWRFVQHVA